MEIMMEMQIEKYTRLKGKHHILNEQRKSLEEFIKELQK